MVRKAPASWRLDPREATQGELQGELQFGGTGNSYVVMNNNTLSAFIHQATTLLSRWPVVDRSNSTCFDGRR